MGERVSIAQTTGNITIEGLDDGESVTVLSGTDQEIANFEVPMDEPTQVVLHKEMFIDATSEILPVRANQDFVDFAFTESGRISDSRQLTLNNHHVFPVEVNWTLLEVMNRTTG